MPNNIKKKIYDKNSGQTLKTQEFSKNSSKKLIFRHFQNRWITNWCTKNKPDIPGNITHILLLTRLTEARARLELREEATASDAKDVIEIVKSTFIDTFADDLGVLDFSRAINGSGISSRSKVKVFMSAVHKLAHAQVINSNQSTFLELSIGRAKLDQRKPKKMHAYVFGHSPLQ